MTGKIKNVVFDLGNVLVHWDPDLLYAPLFPDPEKRAWFLREVLPFGRVNRQLDEGRPYAEVLAPYLEKWPAYREEILACETDWAAMHEFPIMGTYEIAMELKKKGTPLFALTNWSAVKFEEVKDRWFAPIFEGRWVVSGQEHVCKPDPRIYKILLERYKLAASETLFIDDVPENVEGARAAGIEGYVFTTPEALRKTLVELKLL